MAELFRPGTPRLRPSATPVDTYARPFRDAAPTAPADSNTLLDLAGALKDIRPSLDRYFQQSLEEQRQQAEAEGAKAFLEGAVKGIETNRQGWKSLIDQQRQEDRVNGTNNADTLMAMNPHFKRGYIRSHLDSLGMSLEDTLLTEWSQNPEITDANGNTITLQQSDDPAALQSWVRDRTAAFVEQNGIGKYDATLVAEAFLPRASAAMNGISQRHEAFRLEERQREYGQAYSNNLQKIVGGIVATGNTQAGVAALQDRLNQAVADGLNPRTANELLVTAITTSARDTVDASLLNILDGIDTGNGPLGNVGWVREMRTSTRQGIQQLQQSQYRFNVWMEEEARASALRETMGGAARALLADPTTNIMQYQQALIAQGNYSQALALGATQEQLLDRSNNIRPDHTAITSLRGAIRSAHSESERMRIEEQIMTGVANGQFDSNVAMRLFDDLDQSERFNNVLSDPYIGGLQSDLERNVNTLFAKSDYPEDITRGTEAVSVFRSRLTEWIEKNTGEDGRSPSMSEIQKQAEEIASAIYNSPRYTPRDNMIGEGRGQMRTGEQLRVMGEFPENVSLSQLMSAPPGGFIINRTTLGEQDINVLFRDHQQRGDQSLLSELAAKNGSDPATIMKSLMGVDFDPFNPPRPDAKSPGAATPATEAQPGEVSGQQVEAQPKATMELNLTPEVFEGVKQIVGANWWDSHMDQVDLGKQSTALIQTLQKAGVVYERHNGGGFYVNDYGGAVEALTPVVQTWAQQAGIDQRLIEQGDILIRDDDPLYAALEKSDLLSLERTGSNRGGGVHSAYLLSGGNKLSAILYLLTNQE